MVPFTPLPYELQIAEAMVDIALDEHCTPTVKELRLNAVKSLPGYLRTYTKMNILQEVVAGVCRKKLEFILSADTSREITEIMKPQCPKWDASGRVVCNSPYFIPEEELLLWAIVSPHHKLCKQAAERYEELFEQVLGCSIDEYDKKGDQDHAG